MRGIVSFVLSVVVAFAATGCITIGHFNKGNTTQVTLANSNFEVVESNIQGTDTGVRYFGLGESPSHAKAMAQLREKAGLDGTRRALVNVTEEKRIFTILVYSTTTLTLTADVVEFGEGSSTHVSSTGGGGASPYEPGDSTEPASAESLLRQYVARHNVARDSGSFADLVQLFQPDGQIVFHGSYEGKLSGRDAIQEAFEKYPPKDSLALIRVKPTTRGAMATFAHQSAPDVPVGKLAVRVVDGKIVKLDIQRDE